MTYANAELEVITNEIVQPMDIHIAEGIAVNGLFCFIQEQLISDRLESIINCLRSPEKKITTGNIKSIAYSIGNIPVAAEESIDTALYLVAAAQNDGMRTIQAESSTIGDYIWSGFDAKSSRIFNLYKRNAPLVMTNHQSPVSTTWGLRVGPGRM